MVKLNDLSLSFSHLCLSGYSRLFQPSFRFFSLSFPEIFSAFTRVTNSLSVYGQYLDLEVDTPIFVLSAREHYSFLVPPF